MKKEINVLVEDIKKHPKVVGIILFGSYVKKKLKSLSDIDIAVIVKNPDKSVEADIASFSSNVFDVVNFHKLPLYIQFEVLRCGKPLFIRDKRIFSEIKGEVLRDYLEMSYLYERMNKRILA